MIVREYPNLISLFFIKQGSIIINIIPQLIFILLFSSSITAYDYLYGHLTQPINLTIFTMFGLSLSLFLGFRNNTAYDRWWEGRNIWGRLVMETRAFARSVRGVLTAPIHASTIERLDNLTIAFPIALRHQCQKTRMDEDIRHYLIKKDADYVLSKINPANIILLRMAEILGDLLKDNHITDVNYSMFDEKLDQMALILASCERLNKTPIPFAYNLLVKRTAVLYCILVPFGLVNYVEMATPVVSLFIAYTFFGFDALAIELEDPFKIGKNGLPLQSMSVGMERSIRDMQGKTGKDIPKLPTIKNFVLK